MSPVPRYPEFFEDAIDFVDDLPGRTDAAGLLEDTPPSPAPWMT